MTKRTLTVALPEELYGKFIEAVTEEGGLWRGISWRETSAEAIESAVIASLMLFLQDLDGKADLPEFRYYMLEKYPELDEDMVTMMEELIERVKKRKGGDISVESLKLNRQ